MKHQRLCYLSLYLISSLIFGCGDDDEPPNDELVANFLRSEPPVGSIILWGCTPNLPAVTLYFDQLPASVTVNGIPAKVVGQKATWFAEKLYRGPMTFSIEWKNRDGSDSVGATIGLKVYLADECDSPEIVGGSVKDGEKEADYERLNAEGITIEFDEPVLGNIDIRPVDGDSLGWEVEWKGHRVTMHPGGGEKLVNGIAYVIEGVVEDRAGLEIHIKITFVTKA